MREGKAEGNLKRLLVITSSFPRHDTDLSGHFVKAWCQALARRGFDIDVLAWRGPGARDRRVSEKVEVRFVPYGAPRWEQLFFGAGAPENLESRPGRALLAAPAAGAMFLAALRACGRREYDGVIGHWLLPGGILARAVGAAAGIPSAVVGHSGGVHLLERLPAVLGVPLAKVATAGPLTVPTAALRDKVVTLSGARHVEVAPMGFEPPSGDDGPFKRTSSTSATARRLRLGFLGRLVPIKGLPTIFEAIGRLRGDGIEVSLDVVGDGPCRADWVARAGGEVRFYGTKFGDEKNELLKSWDLLVMPSKRLATGRHEGLPVAILEAASVGTVPLVSGVPSVEPWLAEPSLQVMTCGDVDSWCQVLVEMAGWDEPRWADLRARSRQKVEKLAWPAYGPWWEDWLSEPSSRIS